MFTEFQNILILAPHTDDAELGCGGTIARMLEANKKVSVAAFSTAEESVPKGKPKDTLEKEFFRALATLGVPKENSYVYHYPVRKLSYHRQDVLEDLVLLRKNIQPDLILLPSQNDVHQDHQVLHGEGLRAFKDFSVLGYELPWNHITFSAQVFFTLEYHHIQKKWEALQEYKSQLELQRQYFTPEFIEGLAKVRGAQIKAGWAEAFEVLRIVI